MTMLMASCPPQPRTMYTDTGGMKIAMMTRSAGLTMSLLEVLYTSGLLDAGGLVDCCVACNAGAIAIACV